MRLRLFLPLLLVVAGFLALVRLQWKHDLGGLASSPQQIYVELGRAKILGGGLALLRFRAWDGERATLVVRCDGVREVYDLRTDDQTGPVCGVEIRFMLLLEDASGDPPTAWVDVQWPAEEEPPTD